jgi:hypothetical protein
MVDINSLYTEEEKIRMNDFKDEIKEFESTLTELYGEICDIRKSGRDPLIAEFIYRNIKSKVIYVQKTLEKNDLEELKKMIIDLKKEIEDAKKQEIINVKKEIETRLNEEGADYIGKSINDDDD